MSSNHVRVGYVCVKYFIFWKEQKNIILIYYTNILKQIKPFDSF